MKTRTQNDLVGNTPLLSLQAPQLKASLFAKLEGYNFSGSVKDRAAFYILSTLLNQKKITKNTTIIESSSGNFGIALSTYCKYFGLKFVCVIDVNINPINEFLIQELGAEVIKVSVKDNNNGYLLSRIAKVKEYLVNHPNTYWVNQYENPLNAESYYHTLGKEICDAIPQLDYVFVGVSSGGTITGVSRAIKERHPQAKVVAVDIVGSVIFGDKPKARYIPGIGSSMKPSILKKAMIDEVCYITEQETILACHELLQKYSVFAGGSSGSVYAATSKYLKEKEMGNAIMIFADRGDRYFSTIYNPNWIKEKYNLILNKDKTYDLF